MKNEKDMIKCLNNLKSDIGQPQHSQLWHYAEILDVIAKYLESTERTGEWIPVSEGLPKEKQEVYVTVYFTEGDTGRAYGYIDGFGKWHIYSTVEGTLNSGYEVTAWMPLPEPYKDDIEAKNTIFNYGCDCRGDTE